MQQSIETVNISTLKGLMNEQSVRADKNSEVEQKRKGKSGRKVSETEKRTPPESERSRCVNGSHMWE